MSYNWNYNLHDYQHRDVEPIEFITETKEEKDNDKGGDDTILILMMIMNMMILNMMILNMIFMMMIKVMIIRY